MTDDADRKEPPPIPGALLDMLEQAELDTSEVLEDMIGEVEAARTVPLSSSVMVSKDEFLEKLQGVKSTLNHVLDQVIAGLPEELRAARWMVRERESYIGRTNEKAREVIAKAKVRSEELVSESYIVEEAVQEANTLVRNAENESRRIRLEAEDHAERRLAEAEAILGELLRYVRESRAELHQSLPPGPDAPI
jgi:Ni,Fe-hydrogenase III large subunit